MPAFLLPAVRQSRSVRALEFVACGAVPSAGETRRGMNQLVTGWMEFDWAAPTLQMDEPAATCFIPMVSALLPPRISKTAISALPYSGLHSLLMSSAALKRPKPGSAAVREALAKRRTAACLLLKVVE